jgi:hypothetical protein
MAALHVMTSDSTPFARISSSNCSAFPHCPPFSHALMAALHVSDDDTWLDTLRPHLLQQLQRLLPPFSALLARADGCTARDDIRLDTLRPHLLQQLQRLLPLSALLARAGGCIVRDDAHLPDSTPFARTSSSNCSAFSHCPPFSHALMPAL